MSKTVFRSMGRRPWITSILVLILAGCGSAPTRSEPPSTRALVRVDAGEATGRRLAREGALDGAYRLPVEPFELLSDFWDCRGRRRHQGIDLAAAGPDEGLGRPVVAMASSRVLEVGTPETDSARFGRRLRNGDTTVRGGVELPTSAHVADYGRVWFFTSTHGSAHTGVLVVTEILEGPLAGYRVRYMHLAVAHPQVVPGAVLDAGQELGLMGGTAVLQSRPHVHIDAEDPQGRRVDLAPYLGLVTRDEREVTTCR